MKSRLLSVLVPMFLAAVLGLGVAPSAPAQVRFDYTYHLYADDDDSGGLSCGDRIQVNFGLGYEGQLLNLTNVRITVPFPLSSDVIPNTIHPAGDNSTDCRVLEGYSLGDRRAVIECPFICSRGDCLQKGMSFGVRFRLRDPNNSTRFNVFPYLTADQTDGLLYGNLLTFRTFDYEPCPPPPLPPFLYVTVSDGLAGDVDLDGLVDPGDVLRYTVTVFNTGEERATFVRMDVPVPDHAQVVPGSVTVPSGSFVINGDEAGDRVVSLNLGSVSRSFSKTFSFEVVVGLPPVGVGQLSTQGLVSASNADSQPSDDPATTTALDPTVTPLDFEPDLAVAKQPQPAVAAPGEVVVWGIDFANQGRAFAPRALLTETVPDHTVFDQAASSPGWSCADGSAAGTACVLGLGDVAVGGTGSRAFAVRVVDPLPAGVDGTSNEVVITDEGTQGPDLDLDNNLDQASVALEAAPDLWVTKSGPGVVVPGETVVYRIDYGNRGSQDATGVRLVETVPELTRFDAAASAGGWSCEAGGAAGASCVLEVGILAGGVTGSTDFAVRVDDAVPLGAEEVVNPVAIADDGANGADLVPGDNGDSHTSILEAAPQMTISKEGPATARPGEVVVFTLTYGNQGSQEAVGVEIHEVVPEGTVFVAGASTPGWSCADGAAAGSFCVLQRASVPAGGGGTVAFAVRVADPLPAGLEVLHNDVVLTRDPGDDPPEGDPGDEVDVPVDGAPDLAVVKEGPAEAVEGDGVRYTLTVSNLGSQDATGVVLTELPPGLVTFLPESSQPGWSCGGDPVACRLELGDVPAGLTLPPVVFEVALPDDVPAEVTEVLNRVTVADDGAGGADADPGNDSAELATRVLQSPEPPPPPPEGEPVLVATLADHLPDDFDGDGAAGAGEVVAYTLLVRNTGTAAATHLAVELPLDVHTRYRDGSVTTTAGAVTVRPATVPEPDHVVLTLGELAASESVTLTWEARVVDELPVGLDHVEVQGQVAADEVASIRTDDPDTPVALDPTRTPLEEGGSAGPPPEDIPTVSGVGLVLLVGALLGLAMRRLRRRVGEGVAS